MPDESTLGDRINSELKAAMKARDGARTSTLRMVRAALQNRRIEKQADLGDDDVLQVLATFAKQRRDAIEQFRAGGRDDLAAKEELELEVVREFLPTPLTGAEVEDLVAAAIAETGASGPADMGRVMGALMPRVKGRADGKAVNQTVRRLLSGGGAG